MLRCYTAMLPRLRAEEELAAIQRGHAFTERPLEAQDRKSYVDQLQRLANPSKRAKRRMTRADLGTLSAMGIPVKRVGAATEGKGGEK